MRRIALFGLFVGFIAPVLVAAPVQAQAIRTWVSGVGDDANPCSRTAPCKTFAGAISKTAAGGEIDCLDPGGFGTVTITKAMTLSCGYTYGSILAAGVPGVTVNATGVADRVVLRGLTLQGVNQTPTPGTIGVRILAAAVVTIEDCEITAFGQQGISDLRTAANVKMFIRNTVVSHNTAAGISLAGTVSSNTSLDNVSIIDNGLAGLFTANHNTAMFRRGVSSGNLHGVLADTGGEITVTDAQLSGNANGATSTGGNVRLANTDVAFNTTGFSGATISFGNNRAYSNGGLGTAPTQGAVSTDHGQI